MKSKQEGSPPRPIDRTDDRDDIMNGRQARDFFLRCGDDLLMRALLSVS